MQLTLDNFSGLCGRPSPDSHLFQISKRILDNTGLAWQDGRFIHDRSFDSTPGFAVFDRMANASIFLDKSAEFWQCARIIETREAGRSVQERQDCTNKEANMSP